MVRKIILIFVMSLLLNSCITKENISQHLIEFCNIPISSFPVYKITSSEKGDLFALITGNDLNSYQIKEKQPQLLYKKKLPVLYEPSYLFITPSKEIIVVDNQLPITGQVPFRYHNNSYLAGEEYLNAFTCYIFPLKGEAKQFKLSEPYISYFNKNEIIERYIYMDNSLYYLYTPLTQFKDFSKNFYKTNEEKVFKKEHPNQIIEFNLTTQDRSIVYDNPVDWFSSSDIVQDFDLNNKILFLLVKSTDQKGKQLCNIHLIDRQSKQLLKKIRIKENITKIYGINSNTFIMRDPHYYYLLNDKDQFLKLVPSSWKIMKVNSEVFFMKKYLINDKKLIIYKLNIE